MEISFVEDMIPDSIPEVSDVEYPCEVCGQESGPYGGRGRKPKRCPEHKAVKSPSTGTRASGKNSTLAQQASEALSQVNGFFAMGAMLLHMPETASQIAAGNEGFKEQAYAALLTDPELCKSILKAGTTSGKLALMIAYVMYAATIAPVAIVEAKENKAIRDAAKAELEDAANAYGS